LPPALPDNLKAAKRGNGRQPSLAAVLNPSSLVERDGVTLHFKRQSQGRRFVAQHTSAGGFSGQPARTATTAPCATRSFASIGTAASKQR